MDLKMMYFVTYVCVVHLRCSGSNDALIRNLITKYKYPFEEHTIETRDGYILKIHRIPHGIKDKNPKEVVLLVHGMGGASDNYLYLAPPQGLAYLMADGGYDVWMLNVRGSLYSRKHKSLSPDRNRKKFWNFSWNEIAIMDVPQTIEYILKHTGKEQIFYVGHSQGTTVFCVMLSEMPEINSKIKAASLMAPAIYLNYVTAPYLMIGARLAELINNLMTMVNWYELPLSNPSLLNTILKVMCLRPDVVNYCMDLIYFLGGANSGLVNTTTLTTIMDFFPSSFAKMQPLHYTQIILSGEFKKYDYGKRANLNLYNSTKPPLYNTSNVKVPVALFYGDGDHYANEKMIEKLSKELPNVALVYKVPASQFNHLDFIMAYNAKEMVYDKLYSFFASFKT